MSCLDKDLLFERHGKYGRLSGRTMGQFNCFKLLAPVITWVSPNVSFDEKLLGLAKYNSQPDDDKISTSTIDKHCLPK